MTDAFPCPYCDRAFEGADSRWQHAKAKHPNKPLKAIKTERQIKLDAKARARNPGYDDESMADRMINAQLQRAMGGPVDEDYLLDWMD